MSEGRGAVRIDGDRARRKTADVMAEAQRDIPAFHLSRELPCAGLIQTAAAGGISVTASALSPIAQWLTTFPQLNGHLRDGQFKSSKRVNLGIAVAHRENVLIVVTLADCGEWTPAEFGQALREVREKNERNEFAPTDFSRPTFTVSNLGGFGIDGFTSIVTPPQVGVLSLGAVRQVPEIRGEQVVIGEVMSATLGLDHRAVDGAYGARALGALHRRFDSLVTNVPIGATS